MSGLPADAVVTASRCRALEPVREFGPFDILSDWAHAEYADGRGAQALRRCEESLVLVEAAGDRHTARYLRYITCLVHEMGGQWSRLRQSTEDLLQRLGSDAGPFWRAKVLGLLSHALIQQGRSASALDPLAEAYGLITDHPGTAYNRGSACHSVSMPLHSALLFAPAVELLRTTQRIVAHRTGWDVFATIEEAVVLGTWGLLLELLGRQHEADEQFAACASAAVRAEVAARGGEELPQLQAATLLQFAYQRLRCDPVDRRLLQLHADHHTGRESLLPRLALVSEQARSGRVTLARAQTALIRADAQRLGESVPAWVATAWLAELEEAEHGETEATRRWRALALGTLERLWLDRAGRFEHLVARHRVAQLSARVDSDANRLWEDALTSVGNRRLLDTLLAYPETALRPVAFIDIDRFKSVNDHYGHDVGDEVLRRVAVLIRGQCRSGDAVIRYGGDEFVVVLAEGGDVAVLAERIRTVVAGAGWAGIAPGLHVTVSIGTSPAGPGALERADANLLALRVGSG